jgi:hypothetical protein
MGFAFGKEVKAMIRPKPLRCSFCGRSEQEVSKLVAGPKVYICDQCVELASSIMEGQAICRRRAKSEPGLWARFLDGVRNLLGETMEQRERIHDTVI